MFTNVFGLKPWPIPTTDFSQGNCKGLCRLLDNAKPDKSHIQPDWTKSLFLNIGRSLQTTSTSRFHWTLGWWSSQSTCHECLAESLGGQSAKKPWVCPVRHGHGCESTSPRTSKAKAASWEILDIFESGFVSWFWWFVFNLTNLNLYNFLGGNSNPHQGCSDVHHLAVRDGIQGCRWAWCCRTFDGQSWHGHSNQFKVMALTLWIQPEDCTGNLWPMSRSWKREFWNHHSYLVLASAFRLANGGRLWRFCSSSLLRPCFSVTSSSWPRMHSACPELDPWLGMIFWKPWRLKLGAENLLRA